MLNADRVSAGDSLKLMVSGSQIHKKQTIVKQNKVDRAGCRTINVLLSHNVPKTGSLEGIYHFKKRCTFLLIFIYLIT